MQACYVNTTHPDFLNGHRASIYCFDDFHKLMHFAQAMSIVQDRLNANKPATPVPDAKSGKLPPGQVNNNRDLDVDLKKEEPSFFGSFFSSAKKGQPKKAGPVMEAVCHSHIPEYTATYIHVS